MFRTIQFMFLMEEILHFWRKYQIIYLMELAVLNKTEHINPYTKVHVNQ